MTIKSITFRIRHCIRRFDSLGLFIQKERMKPKQKPFSLTAQQSNGPLSGLSLIQSVILTGKNNRIKKLGCSTLDDGLPLSDLWPVHIAQWRKYSSRSDEIQFNNKTAHWWMGKPILSMYLFNVRSDWDQSCIAIIFRPFLKPLENFTSLFAPSMKVIKATI